MTFKQQFSFILSFFSISCMYCQKESLHTVDSLLQKDFNELHAEFFDTSNTDAQASLYADAYLKKAKQLKDAKKIIHGYYYKGLINTGALKLKYTDSLMQYSAKHANNYYMENALVIKAGDLFQARAYKKALDLYIEAQQYAEKSNNKLSLFNIEYNIGITNNLIGDYETGLKTFKKVLKSFDSLESKDEWKRLRIMSSMIISYRHLKMHDSVTYYTKKGIRQTYKRPKYAYFYNLFILNEGINSYFKKEYSSCTDSIKKVIPYFKSKEDNSKLTFAYFYLGKTNLDTQKPTVAIDYFKKVDSIFLKINYLFPETRATYEILIDHYKKKKNLEKQLIYIERLLRLDSILHDKELYLTKRIFEDYNTPRLLANKQQIITSLQQKEQTYFMSIVAAILAIILIGIFLIYNYVQRKLYKKRFEQLLKDQEEKKQHTIIDVSDLKKTGLNIPEDIVTTILSSLEVFKEKNEFLSPNITLQKLAKRLKTNHSYLSKIVNVYEGKSFNTFINDLRIDYTTKRLQSDAIFRKYTIDAIAKESGFSNTRTFSRAFHRKTNLNASYFIKNLNSLNEK